jgi:hypothetical protein
MNDILSGIFQWIKEDWKSNHVRFTLEVVAWALSIGCSLIMAFTVPNPPLLLLYPLWITGCAIYSWCAFSRRSFGMLANYLLLTAIDTIGLVRIMT